MQTHLDYLFRSELQLLTTNSTEIVQIYGDVRNQMTWSSSNINDMYNSFLTYFERVMSCTETMP